MAVELLVPVLDGSDPSRWNIWGMAFSNISDGFYRGDHDIPSAHRYFEPCSLLFVPESEERLFERTGDEWLRVVGGLIDGGGTAVDRAAVTERLMRLCAIIQSRNEAWYRKLLRFHVYVLYDTNDATQRQSRVDFAYDVKLQAQAILNMDVTADLVKDREGFADRMRVFEGQLLAGAIKNGLLKAKT